MGMVGRSIGNYVLKEELGRGGMGVVYRAEHPVLGRQVAIKVLHLELAANPEMVQRIFQEATVASRVVSAHVVEALDFGEVAIDGQATVYLTMELLDGESLGRRAWREGLQLGESLAVVRQCCTALQAAHAAGIVHRDLKPENVFLTRRGDSAGFVKILDFGIAKLTTSPSMRTRTGVLLGTPAYMSPEQCRGVGPIDHRSDVYSLGAVLYELVAGKVPFAAQGYGDVLLAQMTQAPAAPTIINPQVPAEVEAIILRALAKEPEARYQSMQEMGDAIARAEESLSPAAAAARPSANDPASRRTLVASDTERDARPLGSAASGGNADELHRRTTLLKDTPGAPDAPDATLRDLPPPSHRMHDDPTQIKSPPPAAAAPAAPTVEAAAPAGEPAREPVRATPPGLGRRMTGVKLTAAVNDTGELQQIMSMRGADPTQEAPTEDPTARSNPPSRARLFALGLGVALAVVALVVLVFRMAR
jgi:serine/threonine-protein kinase